jgi:homeobox-leucine zipper protein
VNSSPNKLVGSHLSPSPLFSAIGGGIMCAKASMLLQVYTCSLLFLY